MFLLVTVTGIGIPFPPPPQLLHFINPLCWQDVQPTSPSDHFVHMHGSYPEPLHRGQDLEDEVVSAFSWSSRISRPTQRAPAVKPTVVTSCDTSFKASTAPEDGSMKAEVRSVCLLRQGHNAP